MNVSGWKLIETKTVTGGCILSAYTDGYNLKVTVNGKITMKSGYGSHQTVCTWNDARLNVGTSQYIWSPALEPSSTAAYQLSLVNRTVMYYSSSAGDKGCYGTLYAPLLNPL